MESLGKNVTLSPFKEKNRQNWKKHLPMTIEHKAKLAYSNRNSKGIASTFEKEVERKKKISDTMKLNPKAGGLRHGSGRGIKTWYNSIIAGRVYLRSTYELRYVTCLDRIGVKWEQNVKGFEYLWENKKHLYYPDFYLIDEKCFIEVKGFKTEKDQAKWEQFPYKLCIIYLKELEQLEEKLTWP